MRKALGRRTQSRTEATWSQAMRGATPLYSGAWQGWNDSDAPYQFWRLTCSQNSSLYKKPLMVSGFQGATSDYT